MGKVTVWKCIATGKFFEDSKSFRVHLCERAYEKAITRREQNHIQVLKQRLAGVQQMTSFAEIEDFLNDHTSDLVDLAIAHQSKFRRERQSKLGRPVIRDIKLTEMRWMQCQTTHSAPMGMQTTGWSKDRPHIPRWGWRGDIHFTQKKYSGMGSDLFEGTAINTEGGGGGDKMRYTVVLFELDFPLMLEMMKSEGRLNPAIPYPPPPLPSPVPACA